MYKLFIIMLNNYLGQVCRCPGISIASVQFLETRNIQNRPDFFCAHMRVKYYIYDIQGESRQRKQYNFVMLKTFKGCWFCYANILKQSSCVHTPEKCK